MNPTPEMLNSFHLFYKMVITAMMAGVAFVLNTFVYFPAMAPFQHCVNVIAYKITEETSKEIRKQAINVPVVDVLALIKIS